MIGPSKWQKCAVRKPDGATVLDPRLVSDGFYRTLRIVLIRMYKAGFTFGELSLYPCSLVVQDKISYVQLRWNRSAGASSQPINSDHEEGEANYDPINGEIGDTTSQSIREGHEVGGAYSKPMNEDAGEPISEGHEVGGANSKPISVHIDMVPAFPDMSRPNWKTSTYRKLHLIPKKSRHDTDNAYDFQVKS